jgi:hypothetical protein
VIVVPAQCGPRCEAGYVLNPDLGSGATEKEHDQGEDSNHGEVIFGETQQIVHGTSPFWMSVNECLWDVSPAHAGSG